ncbi:hypothetical protein GAY29_06525 [Azospirillum brasilense]|uniref:hypothetical protein n=1 Tax=Azospirillum brasilense TaxID=192 RepID=UPI00190C9107|nr:hypothetical protein [Azospirillum brasilense]MBK3732769.1 hypothetical protein [Azospirillum brasilense]
MSEASHERMFFDAMTKWHSDWKVHPKAIRLVSIVDGTRHAANLFEMLAGRISGVPKGFKARMIRIRAANTPSMSKSLGEAQWAELGGLTGTEREREALRITREDCLQAFLQEEALWLRGRTILSGSCPDGAPAAICELIYRLLRKVEDELQATGNIYHKKLRSDPRFTEEFSARPDLWRAAGFPIKPKGSPLQGTCQAIFVPSPRMVASGIGVVICDSGWNVQPACDLSSSPFVFRSADEAFMATPAFIQGFKNRAGHHVLAYLGERELLGGDRLNAALAAWEETIHEEGDRQDPEYARLEVTSPFGTISAFDVMDRYRKVAECTLDAVARIPRMAELRKYFWLQGSEDGLERVSRLDFSWTGITRNGANYKAIRKSVITIRLEDTGSVRAVMRSAGHRCSSVIMPHYLNAPHIAAEFDEMIRRFQESIQALAVRKLDQGTVATTLGISKERLEQMRLYAERAGIAAALGLVKDADSAPAEHFVLEFVGSDEDSLAELYLAHRALQELRRRTRNHARYNLRFLPMLAMVKAIGRQLLRSGYAPRYRAVARAAARELRENRRHLPFFGE